MGEVQKQAATLLAILVAIGVVATAWFVFDRSPNPADQVSLGSFESQSEVEQASADLALNVDVGLSRYLYLASMRGVQEDASEEYNVAAFSSADSGEGSGSSGVAYRAISAPQDILSTFSELGVALSSPFSQQSWTLARTIP